MRFELQWSAFKSCLHIVQPCYLELYPFIYIYAEFPYLIPLLCIIRLMMNGLRIDISTYRGMSIAVTLRSMTIRSVRHTVST